MTGGTAVEERGSVSTATGPRAEAHVYHRVWLRHTGEVRRRGHPVLVAKRPSMVDVGFGPRPFSLASSACAAAESRARPHRSPFAALRVNYASRTPAILDVRAWVS